MNGRLKNKFKFFDQVIPVSYFKKLNRFLRLACAIINRFCGPLFAQNEFHEELIPLILDRLEKSNDLQKRVEEDKLHLKRPSWTAVDKNSVLEFPRLSLPELKLLTLGGYIN